MELIALTNFDDFPIDITDSAFEQMHAVLSEAPDCFIRVACKGGGCSGLLYDLSLDNEPEEDDLKKEWTREERKVRLIVDLHSASYLKDLTVDYVDNPLGQSGFKFNGGASVKKTCGCGKSFSID